MSFKSWATIKSLKIFRTAKYKQRRVLNETGWIKDVNLKVGACTALSFEWLSAHHTNPGATASSRVDSLKVNSSCVSMSTLAGIFNDRVHGRTYQQKIQIVARERLRGRSDAGKTIKGADTQDLIGYLDEHPGYCLMVMELAPGPTSHLCSCFDNPKGLTFFDPNSGEYYASNDDRATFIAALHSQYATFHDSTSNEIKARTITSWHIVGVNPG